MKKILICLFMATVCSVFAQNYSIDSITVEEALLASSNCEICDESQWHSFATKEIEISQAEARLALAKKNIEKELRFLEVRRLEQERNKIIMASMADWNDWTVDEVYFVPHVYLEQKQNQHYLGYEKANAYLETFLLSTNKAKKRLEIIETISLNREKMDQILIHFFYLEMLKSKEEDRKKWEEERKKYFEESTIGETPID